MVAAVEKKDDIEILDPHFAVFNGHVNDAHIKAMTAIKEHFPSHFEEIERFENKGFMSIFEVEPTKTTLMYVGMVTVIVNDHRGE